jgi:hypothetical protein
MNEDLIITRKRQYEDEDSDDVKRRKITEIRFDFVEK